MIKYTWLLYFCSILCAHFQGIAQNKTTNKKPNIIFILTDDQREDALGANGNRVIITPEIDRLAQSAIRFTNANVVFSLCSPSRAAILTGRYGSANGVLDLGSDINRGEKTMASYLKEAGYNTAMLGKWHIGQKPENLGFDFHVYFDGNGIYYHRLIHDMGKDIRPAEHCDEYCVDRAIDFLKEATKKTRPFFLFQNTQLPHMNANLLWNAKLGTLKKYNPDDMPVAANRLDDLHDKPEYLKTVRNRTQALKYGYPDAKAIQEHTREYYSVITEMDEALGRLIKTIDDQGILDNTYIFFLSDNGWMLGEHGFTSKVLPYAPSDKVPLFVLGPGISPQLDNQIVLNIDMTPTILDLAGVKIPGNIHGKSIAPLLFNKKTGWRKAFVYEGLGTYGGAKPNLAVYNDHYRYIVTYDDKTLESVNFKELYDEDKDPGEMHNLANDPDYADVIKELNGYIDNHRQNILNMK